MGLKCRGADRSQNALKVTPCLLRALRGRNSNPRNANEVGIEDLVNESVATSTAAKEQGALYGYSKKRSYHPITVTRSDTGEILDIRMGTDI